MLESRPAIREGVPSWPVEPSCASVFRDELPILLFDEEDAHRLAAQTKTLGELLLRVTGSRQNSAAMPSCTSTATPAPC